MVRKRVRVLAVTGSRADFCPLTSTLHALDRDRHFDLRVAATGMHLMPAFGRTVNLIRKEGFRVDGRVPISPKGDGGTEIAAAMGAGMAGFARLYSRLSPDLLLVLGDRFEILSAVSAALPMRIPVAHLHGGEVTVGVIDEACRHAISKMSHVHFVALPEYARRLKGMGEEPWRICVSGSPGVEFIKSIPLLSREEVAQKLNLDPDRPWYPVTFHPESLRAEDSGRDVGELLGALEKLEGQLLFSGINADPGGAAIRKRIMAFVKKRSDALFQENFGYVLYLSLMRQAAVMIGNSSSGIIEAGSFRLPVINIGSRQARRGRGRNVIDASCRREAILRAFRKASSAAFRESLKGFRNPYDRGGASRKISKYLQKLPGREKLLKKVYFDR